MFVGCSSISILLCDSCCHLNSFVEYDIRPRSNSKNKCKNRTNTFTGWKYVRITEIRPQLGPRAEHTVLYSVVCFFPATTFDVIVVY